MKLKLFTPNLLLKTQSTCSDSHVPPLNVCKMHVTALNCNICPSPDHYVWDFCKFWSLPLRLCGCQIVRKFKNP